MEIRTGLAGKKFFPNPKFVQVLFEAIANAFDAGATQIAIKIRADDEIEQQHLEVEVSDDGEGLTDERWKRFREIVEPADKFRLYSLLRSSRHR